MYVCTHVHVCNRRSRNAHTIMNDDDKESDESFSLVHVAVFMAWAILRASKKRLFF